MHLNHTAAPTNDDPQPVACPWHRTFDDPQPAACPLYRTFHYDVPVVRMVFAGADGSAQVKKLHQQLQGIHTFKIASEIGYGQDTQAQVDTYQPHAVIIEVADSGADWLETAQHFARIHPDIRIALLADYTDKHLIRQAMHAGVTVFLSTAAHAVEIENAIRSVLSGGMYFSPQASAAFLASYGKFSGKPAIPSDLTPRQLEVLRLIAESHTTKQIAHRLHLSSKTVETYRTQLMKRLGIHDVAGLVRYAISVGLVSADDV